MSTQPNAAIFPLLLAAQAARPFDPSRLATLFGWLDPTARLLQEITGASASTPANADTNPVGTWRAAAPGGAVLQFVAPATGQRPLLRTARLNGKPLVVGDGVDDKLMFTAGSPTAFPSLQVAVVIEAPVAGAAVQNVWEFRRNGVTNPIDEFFKLNADTVWTGRTRDDAGASLVTTTTVNTNVAVYELDWDGSNQRMWANGSLVGGPTARTGTITMDQFAVVNHVVDAANSFKSGVGDLVVYTGQRDGRVWPWLKARWGF